MCQKRKLAHVSELIFTTPLYCKIKQCWSKSFGVLDKDNIRAALASPSLWCFPAMRPNFLHVYFRIFELNLCFTKLHLRILKRMHCCLQSSLCQCLEFECCFNCDWFVWVCSTDALCCLSASLPSPLRPVESPE